MQEATIKPRVSSTMFPIKVLEPDVSHLPNVSRRRIAISKPASKPSITSDDFGDDGIDDDELLKVSFNDLEFDHIENYANPSDALTWNNTTENAKNASKKKRAIVRDTESDQLTDITFDIQESVQMANGKWACNHPCKNKILCRHLCCKTGLDKPPKAKSTTKLRIKSKGHEQNLIVTERQEQLQLQLTASKRKASADVEELDLTQQNKKIKAGCAISTFSSHSGLRQLHETIRGTNFPGSLHLGLRTRLASSYSQGGKHDNLLLDQHAHKQTPTPSDYADVSLDGVSPQFERRRFAEEQSITTQQSNALDYDDFTGYSIKAHIISRDPDTFDDDAMTGLASSRTAVTGTGGFITGDIEALHMGNQPGLEEEETFATHVELEWLESAKQVALRMSEGQSGSQQHSERCCQPMIHASDNLSGLEPNVNGCESLKTNRIDADSKDLEQTRFSALTSKANSDGTSCESEGTELPGHLSSLAAQQVQEIVSQDLPLLNAFEDIEPWLFQEFGSIVELVDG